MSQDQSGLFWMLDIITVYFVIFLKIIIQSTLVCWVQTLNFQPLIFITHFQRLQLY